jgi:hypothetical protein
MPRNNWNERLATKAKHLGALIALIVACFVYTMFIWQISAQKTENRIYAERNAYHYIVATDAEIERTCVTGPPAEFASCIVQIVKSSEEAKRAEYDLQAQKDVADWSFWMLLVSGLGMLFTVAGIWFVRENLIEMQRQRALNEKTLELAAEANGISREIGQWQTRAYLSVERVKALIENGTLMFWIGIQNTGQTPARNLRINGSLLIDTGTTYKLLKGETTVEPPITKHKSRIDLGGDFVSVGKEIDIMAAWIHTDIDRAHFDRLLQGHGLYCADFRLIWSDVFGNDQTLVFTIYPQGEAEVQSDTLTSFLSRRVSWPIFRILHAPTSLQH